ncbi:uncharacterized protein LOC105257320 [Camponotus floridanus]|uniref:uncharacterized protein LOC105257320 n=1 Tax=Camponotus floridanus TaxID=104421 RepID=UPI000DC690BA|nr:uncharacterized protein LOC105257320 [Camponotus floridanus]
MGVHKSRWPLYEELVLDHRRKSADQILDSEMRTVCSLSRDPGAAANGPATARVAPARSFYNSGLDYAGPVTLKTWKGRVARTYKGYLAIFVCLATSAVHIKVVTDYTTDAFIAAYKRFTSRRVLRRQFKTSSKELRHLASLLANDHTIWRFNPPAAPHFGGKWEVVVKSTKYHLQRVLKETVLIYEEMTTINADRSGEAPTAIPESALLDEKTSRLSRWQLLRQKVDHFWTRWSFECLQRYQAVSKWHHPSNDIKEGTMFLIADERYPPGKWLLARVTHLHPGPDGLTRVITVRTATSVNHTLWTHGRNLP